MQIQRCSAVSCNLKNNATPNFKAVTVKEPASFLPYCLNLGKLYAASDAAMEVLGNRNATLYKEGNALFLKLDGRPDASAVSVNLNKIKFALDDNFEEAAGELASRLVELV